MDPPYFFQGVGDNHPVATRQFGSDTRRHSPALSEYQDNRANSIISGSTYQQDVLRPFDSRCPQPQRPSLPWNTLHSQPMPTSNTLSLPPIATLFSPPPRTLISDPPYPPPVLELTSSVNIPSSHEAYPTEVDRERVVLPSIKNLLNPASPSSISRSEQLPRSINPPSAYQSVHTQFPAHHAEDLAHGLCYHPEANHANRIAPVSQLFVPEGSSPYLSRASSRSEIPSRCHSHRPSPLSPRHNVDGHSVERYQTDKGKGRARYVDDSHPRLYPVAKHQSTALVSQSGSVENERARLLQVPSTNSPAGLTEALHPQPSLPAPMSTQAASLNHVAIRTPEIISSNQTNLFTSSHDFAMNNSTIVVHPPGTGSQQSEHSAGVGKSAIVQTVADSLSVSERLIASLFFSRPNGRSNPQRVFPTIAYQLASQDAAYRTYIETIRPPDSPLLEAKAMKEQFRLLIIDPLVKHKLFAKGDDILIAIDGLDECDGDPGADDYEQTCHRRRTFKEVHREIVELISGFVEAHPSIPAIWVIASQPESHITAVFGSDDVKGSYVEESILIDNKEACADVEKFLVASFKKIAETYPNHITKTPWPAYDQLLQITKAASGLFIFGEVVIRFIDDPREENPVSQLNQVLAAIANLRQSRKNNPLSALDVIYTAILSRIPPTRMENLKKMLPLMIYVHRRSINVRDYNCQNMYEHFDISREDAITSFNYLHSVIYFPHVKHIDKTQPQFYHASFRDYLEDPSRSCEYTVEKWNEDLTWPPSATVAGDGDLSNLCKSITWAQRLLKGLSPSGCRVEVLIHRYKISDSGLLQDILDGLDFRSLLLENLHNFSFRDLHREVTAKVCSHL
ncbi:hypothetical protein NP233_g4139 [Leucocoprinus birnbaumii]|uniref:Nephrocystin 3-like N-terminal domain-containing protein n=1 Tax=Leucocoprinus birnbaumii TaxID=56174 RepID=A0AAD5VVN3_9AGAR|nr:hypothetical protein NP233_g4139 [Leucocoprinus birnbaumii]